MLKRTLLKNSEFKESLEKDMVCVKKDVFLISAFLKIDVLRWIDSLLAEGVSVTVLSRWRPQDLVVGASDFESYWFATDKGWSFYIDNDLHVKAMLLDESLMYVGSANFTSRGTHLFGFGNNELSVRDSASREDVKKIYSYKNACYKMTKPMCKEMQISVSNIERESVPIDLIWPIDIQSCIVPVVENVWVDECLFTSPVKFYEKNDRDIDFVHDREIFGGGDPRLDDFLSLRIVKWLDYRLDAREMRFGEITAQLHSSLINDPKPYRKDVKKFVSNLIDWGVYFRVFEVARFNRTISIRKFNE
tara:strand:+ start:12544 stop:13455 length:912 start_codon:yes stop_codon:yes gene_type:complete